MQIDISSLTFITPPANRGQAVEYSYAAHKADQTPACIVQRRREAGEPDQFSLFMDPQWESEDSSNLDFANGEPELGNLVAQWTDES